MASYKTDLDSLVYSYLLKKAPKCAELFSKSNKVKRLQSGSASLEDIFQKVYPNTAPKKGTPVNNVECDSSSDSSSEPEVSKPVQSQNVNLAVSKNACQSESSSDSSDSQQTSTKPNISVKGTINPVTDISLNKQRVAVSKTSSSSSSDSDDEPSKPVAKPNVIPKNISKSPLQKAKEDSSSSSDESEPAKASLPQNSKVLASNIQLSKTTQNRMPAKKSSSSSDDSSSEPNKKVQLSKTVPNKAGNWSSAISKFAAEFSDSSDSESDEAGVAVSLVKSTSTPVGSVKNIKSPGIDLRNSTISKPKQSDSSDDSSSGSECEESTNSKNLGNKANVSKVKNTLMNSPAMNNHPVPAKANVKKSESSSDDSSDSEDDAIKSKVQAPVSKTTPSVVKKPGHDVSSSDDSDDDKRNLAHSQVSKITRDLPMRKPPAAHKDSSDSSSDSEDEKDISKQPVKKIHTGDKDSTSDSSSDSDEANANRMKQGNILSSAAAKSVSKMPVKTTSILTASKKVSDSSSDSSSDEADKAPVNKSNQRNVSIIKRNNTASVNQKGDDSSSSSDSEEQSQPLTSSRNIPLKTASPVKNILSMKIQPPKAKQETSDSSEDSSSEEDKKKANQNRNTVAMVNDKLKMPIRKKDSSSSSDSEDEHQQLSKSSVAVTKSSSKVPLLNKKSESSDSSSDDNSSMPIKQPQQAVASKLQTISSKKSNKKSSSSSSSSDDETSHLAKHPVSNAAIVKPSVPKQGSSSSSDSSDSDDAENHITKNAKQNTSKRPNQICSNSPNKKLSVPSPNKTVPFLSGKSIATNKQVESSSDSSSEEEGQSRTYAPVVSNSTSHIGSKVEDSKALKRKTQSSESDESQSTNSNEEEGETQPSKKKKTDSQPFIANQKQIFNNQFVGKNPVASDSTKQRRGSSPFRRVKSENFVVDHRLQKSAQLAKQSLPSFQNVRGKQFRHEKTKKKRLAHPGKVDTSVKSIKFED